ncbi:MAG: hypothetical protein WAM92_03470 [Mycobacterium sp.]
MNASPAGDQVQLAAGHVSATVTQLERRIFARFGERGLTKAARDLGHLVVFVESGAGQSRDRLRRTTIAARAASIAIVAATLAALVLSLHSALVEGLDHTSDWVPPAESVINDSCSQRSRWCSSGYFPSAWSGARCCGFCTDCAHWPT